MTVWDFTCLQLDVIEWILKQTDSFIMSHNGWVSRSSVYYSESMCCISKQLSCMWRNNFLTLASVQGRISQVNFLFFCINGIPLSQQNASGLPNSALLVVYTRDRYGPGFMQILKYQSMNYSWLDQNIEIEIQSIHAETEFQNPNNLFRYFQGYPGRHLGCRLGRWGVTHCSFEQDSHGL